jgi:antitoxin (DNA-binding transcriptional repressor) of toxin-antitoxin stability system
MEIAMRSISLNEAKTHFSAIISGVEHRGERVIIMKHGVAVAEIKPLGHEKRTETHADLRDIQIKYDPVAPTAEEWPDA